MSEQSTEQKIEQKKIEQKITFDEYIVQFQERYDKLQNTRASAHQSPSHTSLAAFISDKIATALSSMQQQAEKAVKSLCNETIDSACSSIITRASDKTLSFAKLVCKLLQTRTCDVKQAESFFVAFQTANEDDRKKLAAQIVTLLTA